MVEHISSMEEFQSKVLDSDKVTIVDFYADWCGPCKMLGPIFESLAEEMTDVQFVKVNVDAGQDIAMKYQVMSIPTLILVKGGEEVGRQMGAMPKGPLREFVENFSKE